MNADFLSYTATGGWQLHPGAGGILTATRACSATGTIESLTSSPGNRGQARRENADGQLVWHRSGTLLEVIAALSTLPAPSHPDAPTTPIADPADKAGRGT